MKRTLIFVLLFFLTVPVWATQELDSDSNGLIDDGSGGTTALYNAYTEMNARGTIGTGAGNVARGNHTHSYLGGTLSATDGAAVCTTGTGQATAAACTVSAAGMMKWGATGIPATATAGSDYVKGSSISATANVLPCTSGTSSDTIGACTGIGTAGVIAWDANGSPANATRAQYAAAQIIGTNTTATTDNPYSLDAANAYGVIINYGATGTINLPAGAAGMNLIVRNAGAFTITINPQDDAIIVRDGTAQAAGVSMTLSSGAGNYVALYHDGTAWLTLGFKGTLAQGS